MEGFAIPWSRSEFFCHLRSWQDLKTIIKHQKKRKIPCKIKINLLKHKDPPLLGNKKTYLDIIDNLSVLKADNFEDKAMELYNEREVASIGDRSAEMQLMSRPIINTLSIRKRLYVYLVYVLEVGDRAVMWSLRNNSNLRWIQHIKAWSMNIKIQSRRNSTCSLGCYK